ncbi:tyrosine-type recombinase/integrase [Ruminococcus sp.]|uniref:tyrosine-type recombinase/integrase n=1 Tax=Ruminococcus sp. TaxID=41978 RepID=UPI00258FECB4|nr:tyrosine-type recombinase/integrase [Ruminococcus sp.]MCR5019659.1 tyrosine-type recombinase/integrase [Ruminococcus sp.]
MSDSRAFNSSLKNEMQGFIDEKRLVGFKYEGEYNIMKRFDNYWKERGLDKTGLTPENIAEWLLMSDSEGAGSLNERVSVIRQFSKYLNGIGIQSYIPIIEAKYIPPLPHIFTQDEITELFSVIDAHVSCSHVLFSKRMADEYPVLFRLIYLNGLRISEACKLATSETAFDEGIITIQDGKGRKDRLVYLSKDMSELCLQYLKHLEKVTGQRQQWLFPGRHICDPIGIATVEQKFTEFWNQTSFAENCGIKPTVHDLRHTFVVNRINAWSEQGLSFSQMLPYLSKYLGHKTFNETFYYYHYTREAAKNIRKKDSTIKKVIPEVMRR